MSHLHSLRYAPLFGEYLNEALAGVREASRALNMAAGYGSEANDHCVAMAKLKVEEAELWIKEAFR